MRNTHHYYLLTTKLTYLLTQKENQQRSYLSSCIWFHTTAVGLCYLWSKLDFLGKLPPFSTLRFRTLNLDGKSHVKVNQLTILEPAFLSSTTHFTILPHGVTILLALLSIFSLPCMTTTTHIIHFYALG